MSDPVTQAVVTAFEFVKQPKVAMPLAALIGAYWVYVLYQRTFVSSGDPSIRSVNRTSLGFKSMIISGAYVSMAVALVLAVLTWPAPLETPLLGVALVGGVAFHTILEYREAA